MLIRLEIVLLLLPVVLLLVCVCVCVMAMMIMKLFDRLVMMWIVVVTVGLYVAKVSIVQVLAESMGGRLSQVEPACYTGHTFLFTHY